MKQENQRKTAYPSFRELAPASAAASAAKRANPAQDTTPELLLRHCLWNRGLRYRLHYGSLPGKPDLVFLGPRVAVFCDGDFWHGRDWQQRRAKLAAGHNGRYWVSKIEANRARDRAVDRELEELGWTSLRAWETDVKAGVDRVADKVEEAVHG